MAVHAHPDDESSKGAATMARYVHEGAGVMVCTLTGGERGDILNKAMESPEVRANLPAIRRQEMDRARADPRHRAAVSRLHRLGPARGRPASRRCPRAASRWCRWRTPPRRWWRPSGSSARTCCSTYDENGGYPHPDHIKTHQVAIEAFEAAGDPDRYPGCGEPWQPLKLYYFLGHSRERLIALHEEMLRLGLESPFAERLEKWEADARKADEQKAGGKPPRVRHPVTTKINCGDYFERPRPGPAGPRHADRPGRALVRLLGRDPADRLADRGLSPGQVGGRPAGGGYWAQ